VREQQVAAVWIVLVLIGGVLATALDDGRGEPFGSDDAMACATSAADRLGYAVGIPSAVDRDGSWEVTAAGAGLVLRLVVRTADERVTDVAVLRGGSADVLTRDERLVVLEAGCD
jgi:hypothetical protein